MPDLNRQKLILVEVLIPTIVDKNVAIPIPSTKYFAMQFSTSCTSYQRNAMKWQLLNIATKQNSYGYVLDIVYDISQ